MATQETAWTPPAATIRAVPATTPWPCGFWRRVAAALLDALALGIVGWLLALALRDWFSSIGQAARWIGFVIAGSYFIAWHAKTGQSPGKKALGLKVVRLDGTPIDARQAAWRYLAYGLPWILNGMYFAPAGVPAFLLIVAGIVLALVVFGGFFGNIYLLIFNLPARRLVHDVLAGTVVVRSRALPVSPEPTRVAFRRMHLAVVAGLVAAVFGALIWIGLASGVSIKSLEPLVTIQQRVASMHGVRTAQVTESRSLSRGVAQRSLNIVIILSPDAHAERRAITLSAVSVALSGWSHEGKDTVNVRVTEGYDIGIWSQWRSENEAHGAAEWVEVLKTDGGNAGNRRL
jgi:uncharacterized RDD family membrane protein YckC